MEYSELIAARHSVRTFLDREVPRSLLDRLVEEASLAPSSRNSRSSAFMIVEDRDTLDTLSQMRDSGASPLARATAAIVVLGDMSKTDLWKENASISTTFLQLSATNLGLGSCWIHVNGRPRRKSEPDGPQAEEYVKELLGIRDNFGILCIVALGYEA